MNKPIQKPPAGTENRRQFGKTATRIATGIAAGMTTGGFLTSGKVSAKEADEPSFGTAESCILLWMGGGMCHLDTWDPKQVGDPAAGKAGSAYASINTAIPGVRVSEHLPQSAKLLDRGSIVRSVNHPLKVDHADSTNLMKTGRLTSGTVIYPSLGAIVSNQRGVSAPGIHPYVVMGMPNVTRGPGFLGSQHGYVYLTRIEDGPTGLRRPQDVDDQRQERRETLLDALRSPKPNAIEADVDGALKAARSLMNGDFPASFDLSKEPPATRDRYGSSFGQKCLLSRRLVERGVRFVEVAYDLNFKNGTGWDTHRHGQENQHLLIRDLDQALSALIEDLENKRLLEKTLVVLATEFGRPAEFDGQGGRGHQSAAFSCVMFGGGLKSAMAIGATDELGKSIIDQPVSVPDLHATILLALQIDPAKELYDGARPIPVTDHGRPIRQLF
jgi:hypothetical protein